MKRVLVTGATGFIGQHIIRQLLANKVAVIATSSTEQKAREFSWFGEVKYVPFNLASVQTGINLFDLFYRPDSMIHLAWEGLPNYRSAFHLEVNLPRHKEFLKNLLDNGLRDLTVTGTCFEYGMQEGRLRESMPVYPANPYAIAKDELRKFLEEYQTRQSFVLKWVRLFYMYGKGQNPKSLLSQLDSALEKNEPVFNMSGGEQTRDFLPVEKVAANIAAVALQDKVQGIINCCSGVPQTVNQFVEDYLRKKNKSIMLNRGFYPYPDYEPMHFWGDDTKLKTILNNE